MRLKIKLLKLLAGKPIVVLNGKEYLLESIAYQKKIPDNIVLDWKRISESTFKSTLENIYDAVGWKWVNPDTVSLENFF